MSLAAEEIASQPACWEVAAALASAASRELPATGERVAAVGCGTSHNLARAYALLRESAGLGETDAFASSEVAFRRRYDRMVFFSRTGTTTETLQALRAAPAGTPTTAVTASPGTPLAEEATHLVDVSFADEQAVIQTRFATSVLVLLRVHLGEDPAPILASAAPALSGELPEGSLEAHQRTFLGRGWAWPLADEATLKLRETAQVWSEGHNAMEYRHGPISLAEPGVLVWCLGKPPEGLGEQVRASGAWWEAPAGEPLAQLVRAQRLAVALAEAKGLDPDHPRGLQHSVVLS